MGMGEDKEDHWPVVDTKRLFKVRSLQMQNDAIAMILDGIPTKQIAKDLCTKYSITILPANAVIERAQRQITSRKDYEVDSIIELHLGRYEEIYAKFIELKSQFNAASVLKAKERLLQFHKHSTHMKVTNNNISQISIVDVKSDYDFDKVEPHNRQRFQELLDKAME